MSDTSQGPGWWLASDGKWYPPEKAADQTGPSEPDRTPWWRSSVPLWLVVVIGLAALGLGAAVGGAGDEDAAASTPASQTTTSAEADDETESTTTSTTSRPTTTTSRPTTTTTAAPEGGTRENPFLLGTPLVTTDGVEVTATSVDFDAAAAIAAENMFNDEAPPGMRYVMVHLEITNGSDEPIHPAWEMRVNAIGSQNRVHESCRQVLPNSLRDAPELYPGGSAAGNECVVVPQDEVDDGSLLIMIAPTFGDPVFIKP